MKVRRPTIVPRVARRMVVDLAMLGIVRWVVIVRDWVVGGGGLVCRMGGWMD